jgi:hypothetical protein
MMIIARMNIMLRSEPVIPSSFPIAGLPNNIAHLLSCFVLPDLIQPIEWRSIKLPSPSGRST